MDVGFKFLQGLSLRNASGQGRDFRPESSLLSFMNDGFECHAGRVVLCSGNAIPDFSDERLKLSVRLLRPGWLGPFQEQDLGAVV